MGVETQAEGALIERRLKRLKRSSLAKGGSGLCNILISNLNIQKTGNQMPPHHHDPRHHKHHHHGPHRNACPFSEDSIGPVLVALWEQEPKDVSEMRKIIAERAPTNLPILDEAVAKTNGLITVRKLVRHLACTRIKVFVETLEAIEAMEDRVAVILPLPHHHLHFANNAPRELLFKGENELPHHLDAYDATYLPSISLKEIQETFSKVKAIVFDGHFKNGHVTTREEVVHLLDILKLAQIFPILLLHIVPVVPHHLRFLPITGQWNILEI